MNRAGSAWRGAGPPQRSQRPHRDDDLPDAVPDARRTVRAQAHGRVTNAAGVLAAVPDDHGLEMTGQPDERATPSEPDRQDAVRHAAVALRSMGQPNSVTGEFDFWDNSYEGRRLFSELLGTFFLVLVAVGGGMVNARFGGDAVPSGAAVVAPALMVAAIILFMGTVSGAHLNPAVSFALRGDFPWRRVPAYIVAQLIGAMLATLLLWALIGKQGSAGLTLPGAGISTTTAMLWELVLTTGLVSVILGTASGAQQIGPLAAIGVGGNIALSGLWAAPVPHERPEKTTLADEATGSCLSFRLIHVERRRMGRRPGCAPVWQRTPGDPLHADPQSRRARRPDDVLGAGLLDDLYQCGALSYRPGATSAVSRRAPTPWGVLGQFGLPPGSAAGSRSRLGLLPLEPGELTGGQVSAAVPAPACGREGGGAHSQACQPERAAHSDQHRGDSEQSPRKILCRRVGPTGRSDHGMLPVAHCRLTQRQTRACARFRGIDAWASPQKGDRSSWLPGPRRGAVKHHWIRWRVSG